MGLGESKNPVQDFNIIFFNSEWSFYNLLNLKNHKQLFQPKPKPNTGKVSHVAVHITHKKMLEANRTPKPPRI